MSDPFRLSTFPRPTHRSLTSRARVFTHASLARSLAHPFFHRDFQTRPLVAAQKSAVTTSLSLSPLPPLQNRLCSSVCPSNEAPISERSLHLATINHVEAVAHAAPRVNHGPDHLEMSARISLALALALGSPCLAWSRVELRRCAPFLLAEGNESRPTTTTATASGRRFLSCPSTSPPRTSGRRRWRRRRLWRNCSPNKK